MGTKLLSWKEINKITVHKSCNKWKYLVPFIPQILIYFSITNWLGCETDHWTSSSTDVKSEWSCTSTPPTCLHGKVKDNFTFYIYILLSLLTQKIPLFICFLKVKPTLHLHAYIIKEIQYCYTEVIYMYTAAWCRQWCEIWRQKFDNYSIVNSINETLEGRCYL